ncbi:MAG TPA: hypothetical protein VFD92_14305 [Candidatus Binatia bacterium]|nr:hypothetical protein [Candidatus Binatia bacterium]
MARADRRQPLQLAAGCILACAIAACSSGGGSPAQAPSNPDTGPGPVGGCDESFDGTFAAIQKVIFEGQGCAQDACHGSARSGGLDLRPGRSYANLIEAPSTSSSHPRIQPGEPGESFLYLKLLAATRPDSVHVAGSPMPLGREPLSEARLEAVRLWIEGGAPESGSLGDGSTGKSDRFAELLGACLPPAEPITIKPLDPPAPDVGVQFEMPSYVLPASTELEVCFASYYDVSDVVPHEFQDASGSVFYVNGSRLRQDPQSHHFVLTHTGLGPERVNDPAFGPWTCKGGERAGEPCDALDRSSCGSGLCASEVRNSIACIDYGPRDVLVDVAKEGIAGAQTAQQYLEPRDGVFRAIPTRGIVYWNSHAFNLTGEDHPMHARVNLFFTEDLRWREDQATDSTHIYIQAGQAPYTVEDYCADHVAPRGARMIRLSSHTHKRGKHFWVDLHDGTRIYDSFVYSDPLDAIYDPPVAFDDPDPANRTLRYCATYNNGVKDDGTPDPETVTRRSRMPARTNCQPVACAAGRIGEPCSGDDHAACDTSPGAGDGLCDACAITAGVTTENEMFIVIPTYIVPVQ